MLLRQCYSFEKRCIMTYLFISILASVAVSVLLKVARNRHIAIDQAVAVNYLVAIALTFILFTPKFNAGSVYFAHWRLFVALGLLLPGVFLIMGQAVRTVGIIRADAAQRLSLLIAIIAAFTLFGDTLNVVKAIGITLALVALIMIVIKPGYGKRGGSLWLLAVWLGYGVIDILFKQLATTGLAFTDTLLVSFMIAAVFMFTTLLIRGTRFTLSSILGGLVLGMLNFTNIYTYIRAHQVLHNQTALVFTTMNIGVIILATIIGTLILREKLSRANLIGLIVAITAITLLFNADRFTIN